MSFVMDNLQSGNEKTLRKQGLSTLTKKPTTGFKQVQGDYQRFGDVAIICSQKLEGAVIVASLRVARTRQCQGVRLGINGRESRAECFLTSAGQIDDLIERLTILKAQEFGGVMK